MPYTINIPSHLIFQIVPYVNTVSATRSGGKKRAIAYASRGRRRAERNDAYYSAFKFQLLAFKWAISAIVYLLIV